MSFLLAYLYKVEQTQIYALNSQYIRDFIVVVATGTPSQKTTAIFGQAWLRLYYGPFGNLHKVVLRACFSLANCGKRKCQRNLGNCQLLTI
jgi:hypothetical protein